MKTHALMIFLAAGTLAAQQIELMPERRIGIGRARVGSGALPAHLEERIAEQQRIAHQTELAKAKQSAEQQRDGSPGPVPHGLDG